MVYPGEVGLLVLGPVAACEVAVTCLVAACVGVVVFACEGAVACGVVVACVAAVACEGVAAAAPVCEVVAVGTAAVDIAAGGNPVGSRASVVGIALAVVGTALVDPLASAGLTYLAFPCCNYLGTVGACSVTAVE